MEQYISDEFRARVVEVKETQRVQRRGARIRAIKEALFVGFVGSLWKLVEFYLTVRYTLPLFP